MSEWVVCNSRSTLSSWIITLLLQLILILRRRETNLISEKIPAFKYVLYQYNIYQLNFHPYNFPVSVSRRPREDSMTTTRACLTRWRLTIQTIENTYLKWKSKIRIENSNSIEYNMILVVCSLLGESCWDLWGKWALSAFSQTTYFHVDY